MTTEQIIKTIRVGNEAQRYKPIVDAVNTPAFQKAMRAQMEAISADLNLAIKVRDILPPSLMEQVQEQNERIREVIGAAGMRNALANINFTLPEGWAEQVAAFREQLETEVAAEEASDPAGGGIGRLAEEREAIITCLQRIGIALEGFAYLPRSPIPAFVGYLIVMLAVLGEVANDRLSEREDGD